MLTWCLHGREMATSISFTRERVINLTCPSGKGQEIYWDSKTPSLGVRVTANQTRAFIFQARLHGKTIRLTIGDPNSWTLSAAQAEARRLKVLTDRGIDPREERAQQKAIAMAKHLRGIQALIVWNEYIQERSHQWGDRHRNDHIDMARVGGGLITRGLRKGQSKIKQAGILYELLALPLNEISKGVVLAWLKKEVAIRPARARLCLSALKAFLTWASDQPKYKGLVDITACERLARELPPKKAKEDCLQREQLKLWFAGVQKINNQVISSYLQVLLLTGARRNELASMRWADVDLRWNTAIIRDKVEGTRQIPITPYVALLLKSLPRVNEYVFSSPSAKSGRITEPRKAHQQILESMGLPELSIHGLRRSFGTLAEWTECPAGISAQIMGHKPSAIAEKHYRARPIDLLRQWHTKIEKFILDEVGIVQPSANEASIRLVAGQSKP